jgi:hypothetical protein
LRAAGKPRGSFFSGTTESPRPMCSLLSMAPAALSAGCVPALCQLKCYTSIKSKPNAQATHTARTIPCLHSYTSLISQSIIVWNFLSPLR